MTDPTSADGEGLTYVRPAIEALCRTPGLVSPLCGCGGPCVEALEGDTCEDAVALPARSGTRSASLAGYAPHTTGSCGGAGPDRVFSLTLDMPARVTLTARGGDPVLYVRTGCAGPELACNDDIASSDRGARVERNLAAGTYAVFVDAYDGATDDVTLEVTIAYEPGLDAASIVDAAPTSDATTGGADAGVRPNEASPGCGCRTTHHRAPMGLGVLIGLALWASRRRARPR